jgi:hypothetical protein
VIQHFLSVSYMCFCISTHITHWHPQCPKVCLDEKKHMWYYKTLSICACPWYAFLNLLCPNKLNLKTVSFLPFCFEDKIVLVTSNQEGPCGIFTDNLHQRSKDTTNFWKRASPVTPSLWNSSSGQLFQYFRKGIFSCRMLCKYHSSTNSANYLHF